MFFTYHLNLFISRNRMLDLMLSSNCSVAMLMTVNISGVTGMGKSSDGFDLARTFTGGDG